MGKIAILLGILVLACSGESSSDSPTQPTNCDPSLRNGTYLAHFTERPGGTCGAVTDSLTRVDGPSGVGAGCQLTGADDWSSNQCSLSRSFTCTLQNGVTGSYTSVSKDTSGDGSSLTGRFTVELYDASGNPTCLSAYDVVFTRQ